MSELLWSSGAQMVAAVLADPAAAEVHYGDDVTLAIDGLDDAEPRVVAFRGVEGMNRLYRYDVVFAAAIEQEELRAAALARKARLELALPDAGRHVIHGIAAEVALLGQVHDRGLFHLVLAPQLSMLGHRRQSRVFQERNVREVLTEALSGIPNAISLAREYERRAYCLQHDETDHAFVTRLMAEEGLFYWFDHPANAVEARERFLTALPGAVMDEAVGLARGGEINGDSLLSAGVRLVQPASLLQIFELSGPSEVLVIGDTPAAYASLRGAEELVLGGMAGGALKVRHNHVDDFRVRSRVVPTRSTVRGYDYKRAGRPPAGTVIGTSASGFAGLAGSLGDVTSLATEAAGEPMNELGQMGGAGAAAGVGAVASAAGVPLANPAEMLGGTTNESFAYGVRTATHAVMPPEVALGRAGIAATTAIAQGLIDDSGVDQVLGIGGDIAQGLVGGSEGSLEIYEHHGDYEEPEGKFSQAVSRLEQERAAHIVCDGSSHCRRLMPGKIFELTGHAANTVNRAYALVEVTHELGGGATPVYRNAFSCVPASVPFRPERPERRVHQVVESAVVVGTADAEIETERHGCVKVQFHWDRAGKHDEHSSCWIRVMQPWAGTAYGFQFVPRIGMEVLVSFVGGDINRPVVIGCLPNLANAPPHRLPEYKTKSGIRTRSTPHGEGYNELMFEDARGREQIHLRAERDLVELVQHDHTTRVVHDRVLAVEGRMQVDVAGHHATTVGGDHSLTVQGDRHERVDGSFRQEYGGHVVVRGGGSHMASTDGDRLDQVGGQAATTVGQGYHLSVAGSYSLAVGQPERPAGATVHVQGSHRLTAEKQVSIVAEEGVTVRCGDAVISLSSDAIKLTAPKIVMMAGDELTVGVDGGPALRLTDGAEPAGDTVTLLSSAGRLQLDSNASLGGNAVHLGSGDAAGAQSGEQQEAETQPIAVQLTAASQQGYGDCRYHMVCGGRDFRGTTDGDGWLREEVPADAESAQVTLWPGAYPTGPRLSWSLSFGELPDAAELAGARARLRNLGYEPGDEPEGGEEDQLDGATRGALARFQSDNDLEPTGELDTSTISALREAHHS